MNTNMNLLTLSDLSKVYPPKNFRRPPGAALVPYPGVQMSQESPNFLMRGKTVVKGGELVVQWLAPPPVWELP